MAQIRIGSLRDYYSQTEGARMGVPQLMHPDMPRSQAITGMAEDLMGVAVKGLGELMRPVAQGYREAQTEKVEGELLNVERQFARFREEWTGSHKGEEAKDAASVFTRKHEELSKAALERLDLNGDEVYEGLFARRVAQQNLMNMKDGFQYASHEARAYADSQWRGQLASHEQLIEKFPEDTQAIKLSEANLLTSWQAKNPGLDGTETRLKLQDMAFEKRMDTLLARGDYATARRVLAENAPHGAASRGGAGESGQGNVGPRGGSIAEAQCNPLNLMKVGATGHRREDFESFATDGDGFRAAWRQLKIYQNKYGLRTPAEMIRRWAPEKDGNDHKAYFATVKGATGLDLNKPIDMADPAQAALLIKGMAQMESPLGGRYSVGDITELLAASDKIERRQGPPLTAGLSHARYAAKLDELEKRSLALNAASLRQPVEDYLAKCRAGLVLPQPFDENAVRAIYGEKAEAMLLSIRRETDYALKATALKTAAPDEMAAILASVKPSESDGNFEERARIYERLGRQAAAIQKAREKDFAGYAAEAIPEVHAAAQAFLNSPSAQSFSSYKASVLAAAELLHEKPKKLLSAQMSGALADMLQGSSDYGAALSGLRQATGEAFPAIMAEVSPKLGLNALIYASGMPRAAVTRIEAARANPKFREQAEEQLRLTGPYRQNFDDDLIDEMREITETFALAGGEALSHAVRENVRLLAYQYMLELHMDDRKALKRAAREVILDRYVVGKSPSGEKFRLPKLPGVDVEELPGIIRQYLGNMDLEKVDMSFMPNVRPEYQKRVYHDMLYHNATLVTNEDESGVYVFINGKLQKDQASRAIVVTWNEALDWHKKNRAGK